MWLTLCGKRDVELDIARRVTKVLEAEKSSSKRSSGLWRARGVEAVGYGMGHKG